MNISHVEGYDDRTVRLRGVCGLAQLDFANDSLEIYRPNTAEIIAGPFLSKLSASRQHLAGGLTNLFRQTLSLNRRQPYALGIGSAVGSFYSAVKDKTAIDNRFSPQSGSAVISMLERVEQAAGPLRDQNRSAPVPAEETPAAQRPTVLVIGGTGFIGRSLTRELVAQGYGVRVLSRGNTSVFNDLKQHVSICAASLKDRDDLRQAMHGIDTVFHLARASEKTWSGYVENDVEVTRAIAEAALEAGVKRFVYTGTIDSYDASQPNQIITEDTPLDPDIERRNLYARSKKACEILLTGMHTEKGLPLVTVRPGIVVGEGGPLQHWGIGRWHGSGAVKTWGPGTNILPFVLVDDVATGLVKTMTVDGIEGQSFNLIGEPMLTALQYFDEIRDRLGAKIRVSPGSILSYFLVDIAKYCLKKTVLRRKNLIRPAYRDWKSRTQASRFSNSRAKEVLDWSPEDDRERFVTRAITNANLFGFMNDARAQQETARTSGDT